MEKAVELLRDPQYKAYQVSEMLGYKTPEIFCPPFPQPYRYESQRI